MLDVDEFYPDWVPLSDERCDVCNGKLPEETRRGPKRMRHDGCRNAMKRMWIARLRSGG